MSSTTTSTGNNIVDIIRDANTEQRGKFDINSILSSVGFSIGISVILIFAFSVLRPRNTVVYAPKVKYADEKHQPPKLENTPWAWIRPIVSLREEYMLERIGLDAVIFLRFLRLCRNYLALIAIIGCGAIIPINVIGTNTIANSTATVKTNPLLKLTVSGLSGNWMIPHIAFSYVFTILLMIMIWVNYKSVVHLRQRYFSSDEYQSSLHSRTLMMIDLPNKERNDRALAARAMDLKNAAPFSQAQMGREVGKLPLLIEKHEEAVRKLEGYLAKYLKNPAKLPSKRPTCKGKNGQTDAIDYYTNRVQGLEQQIEAARETYDALQTRSYGFISYPAIPTAHSIAKANKRSTVFLSPRPIDIIWRNVAQAAAKRHSNRIFGNILFVSLCILWTVPNALIATFISNVYNLGSVWPWFQGRINADPKLWAVLQGILGPVILAIFYLVLPSIMRKISKFEGRITKNARERNVFHKLFLFFSINNFIIFTLFGVLWNFVQSTIVTTAQEQTGFSGFWNALKNSKFFDGLANSVTATSTFWILYVAQRNLGCLLDLVQAWSLFLKWFKRTFLAPSPREIIEWSAPQNMDYASYYNSFLYNFTICISYATLAPLILPFGVLYFVVSGFTYKYIMLYVAITKVESGGAFWRVLINRLLLIIGFANLVLFVVIWVKISIFTAIAIAPVFVLIVAFKIFLIRALDPKFDYYLPTGRDEAGHIPVVHHNDLKKDRLRSRFGHPSLTQPLIVPMVHEKSRHLLREVYKGRLQQDEGDYTTPLASTPMQEKFEVVKSDEMDFEHYATRADFASQAGGIAADDVTSVSAQSTPGLATRLPARRPVDRTPSGYSIQHRDDASLLHPYEPYRGGSGRNGDIELDSLYAHDAPYTLNTLRGRPRFDDDDDDDDEGLDDNSERHYMGHTPGGSDSGRGGGYDSHEDLTKLIRNR